MTVYSADVEFGNFAMVKMFSTKATGKGTHVI